MTTPLVRCAIAAVAGAMALGTARGAVAQDPFAVVGRAGRIYRNLSSLQADFVQILEDRAKVLDRPQERYQATYVKRDTVGGAATDVVELVPTGTVVPFRKARLWLGVEDALPRRIELDESPGFRRILILSRIRPNAGYNRK